MEISDIAKWIQLTLRSNITLKLKRTMIDRMLRSIPSPRPLLVSEKAQDVGTAMGLGDLRQYRWKDQRKKMKDSKRSIFHYEHKTPLNQIITEMVEDDSVRNIVSAIHKIQIVWILKEEDRLLTKGKGGKSWRVTRPADAYEQLGIKIVNNFLP